MSPELETSNPNEKVTIPVTTNAVLEATKFCIEKCGFYAQAQEMAVISSAMCTGKTVSASWDEAGELTHFETEGQLPNFVLKCRGPRKKYLLFGELTCREAASIDAQ